MQGNGFWYSRQSKLRNTSIFLICVSQSGIYELNITKQFTGLLFLERGGAAKTGTRQASRPPVPIVLRSLSLCPSGKHPEGMRFLFSETIRHAPRTSRRP
jgi:hypothetical protein